MAAFHVPRLPTHAMAAWYYWSRRRLTMQADRGRPPCRLPPPSARRMCIKQIGLGRPTRAQLWPFALAQPPFRCHRPVRKGSRTASQSLPKGLYEVCVDLVRARITCAAYCTQRTVQPLHLKTWYATLLWRSYSQMCPAQVRPLTPARPWLANWVAANVLTPRQRMPPSYNTAVR